jgi:hypothetical protein
MEPSSSSPPAASTAPEVRARHPQTLLRIAQETMPEEHAAIVAALSAPTLATLGSAIAMTWVAVEIDVEVMEATARHLGPAATFQLVEKRQREEMGSALFDGFVQTALRVFGASPANMLKRLPTGWAHLFRNAGWVEIVATHGHDAVARLHRLPAVCIGSEAWMTSLPVGLRTLYEIIGVKGTVECRIEDQAEGKALLTFRWR